MNTFTQTFAGSYQTVAPKRLKIKHQQQHIPTVNVGFEGPTPEAESSASLSVHVVKRNT